MGWNREFKDTSTCTHKYIYIPTFEGHLNYSYCSMIQVFLRSYEGIALQVTSCSALAILCVTITLAGADGIYFHRGIAHTNSAA
jgi:hypothetical protein